MAFEKEKWDQLITQHPSDFSFKGKILPIFSVAIEEFYKLSRGEWALENYKIFVCVNDDESYVAISFVPLPAYDVNGVAFEIADRGMYKNGMGVTYVYSLNDLTLVNRTYMR